MEAHLQEVSAPVSHAQLQIGSIKRGAWGPEQGSRGWDEPCAPSILLGMLQFVSPPYSQLLCFPCGTPGKRLWIPVDNAVLTTCFSLLGNQLSEQQINLQSNLFPGPSTILGANSSAEVWISGLAFLPAF